MTGWEGLIFGTRLRPVPARLGFDQRTRPAGCDFNRASREASKRKRDEHREENSHPGSASHGECNRDSDRAGDYVGRPIPHPAYYSHHLFQFGRGMRVDPMNDRLIEKKGGTQGEKCQQD